MKLYNAIRFLMLPVLSVFILSGCIKESLKDCPLEVSLRFTYIPHGTNTDLFHERVQQVTLCVYRSDGTLVSTEILDKNALKNLQGTTLSLFEGEYTIMVWGNTSDTNTRIDGTMSRKDINNIFISHPRAATSQNIPTLDRLFFGATTIALNQREEIETHTVNLTPSTIRISLQLEGVSLQPAVRISNIATAFQVAKNEETGKWKMQPVEQGKNFTPEVSYDAQRQYAESMVNVPRFGADTPCMIEIINPTNGEHIVSPIAVAELIRRYNIALEGEAEIVIPIQITFETGFAKITVKGWENKPIHPGGV